MDTSITIIVIIVIIIIRYILLLCILFLMNSTAVGVTYDADVAAEEAIMLPLSAKTPLEQRQHSVIAAYSTLHAPQTHIST